MEGIQGLLAKSAPLSRIGIVCINRMTQHLLGLLEELNWIEVLNYLSCGIPEICSDRRRLWLELGYSERWRTTASENVRNLQRLDRRRSYSRHS